MFIIDSEVFDFSTRYFCLSTTHGVSKL
jgi:hypothetical protein